MCGIAGFVSRVPTGDPRPTLRRMTAILEHRGPDDSGFFFDRYAALGHRRLSIVDLASGQQPMFNEDGSLAIVYNGEIYNHADIRPDLERLGHRYHSRCDTETILHAYEQWGDDCPKRFRGMFAFATWDSRAQELFCVRDRLGIKPLYYYYDQKLFAFASEIKALLEHPHVSARFDESALPEYLTFGYLSGERTMFAGIRKLMPGHSLRISVNDFVPRIHEYWQLPAPAADDTRSDAEWVSECRAILEKCVDLRLMSDVPLGMFLSGGLDSSAIAAVMQRIVERPIKTFSVGYREARFSELSYARTVADAIHTDHHEIVVDKSDFFNSLPRLIWHEDEPIAWPSSVSLYHVSKLASQQVKVVLTGEGSDELFAGYGRYRFQLMNRRFDKFYRFVPPGLQQLVRSSLGTSSLISADLRRKLSHTVLGRDASLESLYLDNFYGAFSRQQQHALGVNGDPYAAFMQFWNSVPQLPELERMLWTDKKTYLVELLMKQDQMSMAASIESRVPFLDHQFVEFAARVPARLKLRGSSGKHILKQSVADLLPPDIIHRKKMGFPTPVKQWLLDPECAPVFDLLQRPGTLLSSYIDRGALSTLIERYRSGQEDATDRIWNLLNLQLWGEIFLSGKLDDWTDGLLPTRSLQSAV